VNALRDQVALVTGGASGIGRAVVQRFVREGCRVGIVDINAEALSSLQQEFGDKIITVSADIRQPEGNQLAVEQTVAAFGKLDVFVGNAGLFDGFSEFVDLPLAKTLEAYRQIFDINVGALLLGVRASLEHLVRTRGSIIFTLSNSSLYPDGGGVMYVASKHAALGVMRQLAHEFAPVVRVNGVAAGATRTPIRTAPVFGATEGDYTAPEVDRAIESLTPLAIRADPADHAGAYVLLASRADGKLLTGSVIETDAGLGIRGLRRTRGGDRLEPRK
jgi:2,3-dihydroxy-2,3-dihydrophenylpropionate dehydrogenase